MNVGKLARMLLYPKVMPRYAAKIRPENLNEEEFLDYLLSDEKELILKRENHVEVIETKGRTKAVIKRDS